MNAGDIGAVALIVGVMALGVLMVFGAGLAVLLG